MTQDKPKEKIQKMEFSLEMELIDNFQFKVKYDLPEMPDLITDEPPKIGGEGKGPNPSRLIGTAVANCLSSSLVHCLRRAKADVKGIKAEVTGYIERNDEGLLRLTKIDVTILPKFGSSADENLLNRCKDIFEKYCIVTESIRNGLPVNVEIDAEYEN
jgi:uncharacterized OsmC-like protein